MTDREKAIVMAYTGVCMLTGDKFKIFHRYVEDILLRSVMTHEIPDFEDLIKEKSKADFMALCEGESNSENPDKWIPVSERLPEDSGEYLVSVIDDLYENGDYKETGIGWFAHKKDYSIVQSEWRELGIGERVVAWMPLPQPYKGE